MTTTPNNPCMSDWTDLAESYPRCNPSKKANPWGLASMLGSFGAGERNRTLDLRITSALLYQLSYTGIVLCLVFPPSRIDMD